MTFAPENLGLQLTGLTLLRDLVHERTGIIYLKPLFGRFYVSLPWLWCATLGMTILTGFLTGKRRGGAK